MKKIPLEQKRENYNRYQREYRKRNPEKAALWQLEYYKRKAAQFAEPTK